jgi:hypothetical protein
MGMASTGSPLASAALLPPEPPEGLLAAGGSAGSGGDKLAEDKLETRGTLRTSGISEVLLDLGAMSASSMAVALEETMNTTSTRVG